MSNINLQLQQLMVAAEDKQARRVDAQLVDPITNEELWVDFACVHTTSKTHIAAELKRTAFRNSSSEKKILELPSVMLQTNTQRQAHVLRVLARPRRETGP